MCPVSPLGERRNPSAWDGASYGQEEEFLSVSSRGGPICLNNLAYWSPSCGRGPGRSVSARNCSPRPRAPVSRTPTFPVRTTPVRQTPDGPSSTEDGSSAAAGSPPDSGGAGALATGVVTGAQLGNFQVASKCGNSWHGRPARAGFVTLVSRRRRGMAKMAMARRHFCPNQRPAACSVRVKAVGKRLYS